MTGAIGHRAVDGPSKVRGLSLFDAATALPEVADTNQAQCRQCLPGKSKRLSRQFWFFVSDLTGFGCLAP